MIISSSRFPFSNQVVGHGVCVLMVNLCLITARVNEESPRDFPNGIDMTTTDDNDDEDSDAHKENNIIVRVLFCGEEFIGGFEATKRYIDCLLYTSPSPRDGLLSRMPSSA